MADSHEIVFVLATVAMAMYFEWLSSERKK